VTLATSLVASTCPYCGEPVQLVIDSGCSTEAEDTEEQNYIEDCQVCCRPMQVSVRFSLHGADGGVEVVLRDEND